MRLTKQACLKEREVQVPNELGRKGRKVMVGCQEDCALEEE